MPDMEKVMADIEEQIAWIRDNDFHKFPGWGHAVLAMKDALALLKEQREQIKNRDESLEKAREEIKWLRGMLKEQEAVKPKIDAFGHPCCPKCKILVYETWEFCPHCGQAVKWND